MKTTFVILFLAVIQTALCQYPCKRAVVMAMDMSSAIGSLHNQDLFEAVIFIFTHINNIPTLYLYPYPIPRNQKNVTWAAYHLWQLSDSAIKLMIPSPNGATVLDPNVNEFHDDIIALDNVILTISDSDGGAYQDSDISREIHDISSAVSLEFDEEKEYFIVLFSGTTNQQEIENGIKEFKDSFEGKKVEIAVVVVGSTTADFSVLGKDGVLKLSDPDFYFTLTQTICDGIVENIPTGIPTEIPEPPYPGKSDLFVIFSASDCPQSAQIPRQVTIMKEMMKNFTFSEEGIRGAIPTPLGMTFCGSNVLWYGRDVVFSEIESIQTFSGLGGYCKAGLIYDALDGIKSHLRIKPNSSAVILLFSDTQNSDDIKMSIALRTSNFDPQGIVLVTVELEGASSLKTLASSNMNFKINDYNLKEEIVEAISKAPEEVGKCGRITPETDLESGYTGELEWSQKQIAGLFSASFYGMLTTVWFSGFVADKYGPKFVFVTAVANSVLFTFLTPTIAKNSYWGIVLARFWMGVGEGFIMPCLTSIGSRWFPPSERSTFAAIYTSGNQIGASTALPVSSYLCQFGPFGGWPSIFYFFGIMGLIWIVFWLLFATNTPDSSRFIGEVERDYINESLGKMGKRKQTDSIPWKSIFTSVPFYASIMAQLSFSFSVVLFQTYLPTFLKQVLKVSLKTNGILAILPFVAQIISKNIASNASDLMKKKKILTNTQATKIFQFVGNTGCAVVFLLLAFAIDCDTPITTVITFILFGCFVSCGIPGFFTALLSIAPRYTGTVTSMSLTIGAIGHSSSPALVGFFNKHGTKEEWRIIWMIAVCLHVISAVVFTLYGSAEIQEWAKTESEKALEEGIKLNSVEKNKEELDEIPDNLSINE
ncbi:hypothetical protein FO519_006765 [Halicephalobus sp. NKZ332]|nr:hypothetical protein FO519_006765 [Halicephalobus sp. NKZ332]